MKTLVIPDLHGKNIWKKAIEEAEYDKVVFLGDYVDDFYISNSDIINNLKDIIDYKKSDPDNVTLLMGNHDIQYLFYPHFRCSGFRKSYYLNLKMLFSDNKKLFKYAYSDGVALYTHGGFIYEWFNKALPIINKYFDFNYEDSKDPLKLSNLINNMIFAQDTKTELFSVSRKYRGGNSEFGGPLWCDIKEVMQYWGNIKEENFFQIVGHSRLDWNVKSDIIYYNKVFYTDILDTKNKFIVFDSSNPIENIKYIEVVE